MSAFINQCVWSCCPHSTRVGYLPGCFPGRILRPCHCMSEPDLAGFCPTSKHPPHSDWSSENILFPDDKLSYYLSSLLISINPLKDFLSGDLDYNVMPYVRLVLTGGKR